VLSVKNGEQKLEFYIACKVGDINLVQLLIEQGGNIDWNNGLLWTCRGGQMSMVLFQSSAPFSIIVQLMIEKGASDWNNGLCVACSGGCAAHDRKRG
jgi:hypothetical protein